MQTSTSRQIVYEIRDEFGKPFRHCGSMHDVDRVMSLYPYKSYGIMFLDEFDFNYTPDN